MSKVSNFLRQRKTAKPLAVDAVIPYAEATRASFNSIYSTCPSPEFNRLVTPPLEPSPTQLSSCLCTRKMLESNAFRFWTAQIRETWRMHRKLWEFCYISQALYERGVLESGKRGLGFAVGTEPLPSLFASMGCEIMATDLDCTDERSNAWAQTNQLASSRDALNNRGICENGQFKRLVSFRPADMNRIPDDLRGFDFTWSSCSFEHCGSIGLGKRFLREQLKCLKPGGFAVHTTEFNLSSNEDTIDEGTTVIFRRQDIEAVIRDLQADGHSVAALSLDTGSDPEDKHVDIFPYSTSPHLKLELYDKYVSTSIGLIIQKSHAAEAAEPVAA